MDPGGFARILKPPSTLSGEEKRGDRQRFLDGEELNRKEVRQKTDRPWGVNPKR